MFSRPKILFLVSLLFVALLNSISLAWPDRFFPFLFVVAEKRVWSGSHTHLVLAPRKVTIEHVIVAQVYDRVCLLFGL